MKQTTKVLLSAVLTIALCVSVISGATFALFTSEASTNIAVTAGKVNVTAVIDEASLELYSMDKAQADKFENGGTAGFATVANVHTLTLTNITPGDAVKFNVVVTNNSNVAIKYRLTWTVTNDDTVTDDKNADLADALVATVDGVAIDGKTTDWADWATTDATTKTMAVAIELPVEAGNDYQNDKATINFKVEAVQANGTDLYGKALVSTPAALATALANGEDIVLMDDVVLVADTAMEIAADKEVTLDLNGKTITGTNTKGTGALIQNNGTLTIVGGEIENTTTNGDAVINNAGTLTLDGVSITGAPIDNSTEYPSYAVVSTAGKVTIEDGTKVVSGRGALNIEGGEAVVNGGTFVVTNAVGEMGRSLTLHTVKAESTLTINGGTFENNYTTGVGSSVVCPWGGDITINGGDFRDAVDTHVDHNSTANIQNYMGYKAPVVYGGTFDDTSVNKNLATGYKAVETNGKYIVVKDGTTVATDSASFNTAMTNGGDVYLTQDVTYNTAISKDANIDLAGNTFEATYSFNLSNNADLTMKGGNYEVNGTYGHVDVRPTSSTDGSVVVFEDVDFSFNQLTQTNGSCTNRLGSVIELCAEQDGGKAEVVFKNCTFDNAKVFLEGMGGKVGDFEVTFENCTFNALTSSAPIEVMNYVKATINVKNCTFNIEATSASASAVSISPSSSTTVTLNAENNTINAVAATPTDASLKGTVEEVKLFNNTAPTSVKFASYYGNTTATITGTTATGIAVDPD